MLTEKQVTDNKLEFLNLVKSIKRDGVDIDGLIAQLTNSDFFEAPASTVYHCAFRGGLCEHSLNVYKVLDKLLKTFYGDNCPYTSDSIKIVSLFHDISKMNFYETYYQNKKVYSPNGSKRDEMGKFDWQSVSAYKVRDAADRFLFANHEYNALYIAQTFIPMSLEECTAIIHHMGTMGADSAKDDLPAIYSKYNLAMFLHMADMISTYHLETHE